MIKINKVSNKEKMASKIISKVNLNTFTIDSLDIEKEIKKSNNLLEKSSRLKNLMFKSIGFMVFTLMFVVTFFTFNSEKVHANVQVPLKTLNVTVTSNEDDTTKNLVPQVSVKWEIDTPSGEKDSQASFDTFLDGEDTKSHDQEGYNIDLICLSDGSSWNYTLRGGDAREYILHGSYLKSGRVYKVIVTPYHYHRYKEDYDGEDKDTGKKATYVGESLSRVFLTEPTVSCTTEGTDIIVKFDDAGSLVKYKLQYEAKKERPFEGVNENSAGIDVDPNSANYSTTVEESTKKIIYRITGKSDIKAGKAYSIRVVPRNATTDYNIVMVSNEYIKNYIAVTEAPFEVKEESEDYIKLKWDGLITDAGDIKRIIIFAGKEEESLEEYASISEANLKKSKFYLIKKPKDVMYYKIEVEYSGSDTRGSSKIVAYNPSQVNARPGKVKLEAKSINEGGSRLGIKLNWSPFYYDGSIKFDTYYDILVTDDPALVTDPLVNMINDYMASTDDKDDIEREKKYTYNNYRYLAAGRNAQGEIVTYTEREIRPNTVYYVRVIAKTKVIKGYILSEPAYCAIYVGANGEVYMPPVMAKPPLEKKEVTDTTISLNWKKKWNEIAKKEPGTSSSNINWSSVAWSVDNTVYINKNDIPASTDPNKIVSYDLSIQSNLDVLKRIIDTYGDSSAYIYRTIGFEDDIKYEGFIIQESLIGKDVSYEEYLENINNRDDVWEDLTDIMTDRADRNITSKTFGGLTPNTSYFIAIRAYRIDEDGNRYVATNPTSIIVSTTLKQGDVEPIPTVPTLLLHQTKDIEATIKWKYNSQLSYEVRYSKSENIEGAEILIITNEMINSVASKKDGEYFLWDVYDLFPETGYFFWIKAKQVVGDKESAWSNPLMFVTSKLLPDPLSAPGGIGIAATDTPVSENHLAIEWSRTDEDIALDKYQGTKVHKNITYILEIADNIKFLDSREVEAGNSEATSQDFIVMAKTMVKAINLKNNSRYYVRIKTKITVTEDGSSAKLEKESGWSIVKIFRTQTKNEYDSEYGDIKVSLKERTEKTYDGNKVKVSILNDERVINDMVLDGSFVYIFDFSGEKDKYSIKEAYIPINVLRAMQNRDINIILKEKDMSMNVSSKAFKNMDYANLEKAGGVLGLTLGINDDNSIYGMNVISKDIVAGFKTKYGDVKTKYLEDYMEVAFDITNSVYYSKNPAKGVVYNDKTRTWEDAKDSYSYGYDLILKTGKMGKVGVSY